jgi:hypothetical protein
MITEIIVFFLAIPIAWLILKIIKIKEERKE